ncbi:MAG: hypothetical protein AB7R55_05260 [Gemmatimonadales bacterium]
MLASDQIYGDLELPNEALQFQRLMSSQDYCNWALTSLRDGLSECSTGERAAVWRALGKAEREFDVAWPVEEVESETGGQIDRSHRPDRATESGR